MFTFLSVSSPFSPTCGQYTVNKASWPQASSANGPGRRTRMVFSPRPLPENSQACHFRQTGVDCSLPQALLLASGKFSLGPRIPHCAWVLLTCAPLSFQIQCLKTKPFLKGPHFKVSVLSYWDSDWFALKTEKLRPSMLTPYPVSLLCAVVLGHKSGLAS